MTRRCAGASGGTRPGSAEERRGLGGRKLVAMAPPTRPHHSLTSPCSATGTWRQGHTQASSGALMDKSSDFFPSPCPTRPSAASPATWPWCVTPRPAPPMTAALPATRHHQGAGPSGKKMAAMALAGPPGRAPCLTRPSPPRTEPTPMHTLNRILQAGKLVPALNSLARPLQRAPPGR